MEKKKTTFKVKHGVKRQNRTKKHKPSNKLNIYVRNLKHTDVPQYLDILSRLTSQLPRDIWIKVGNKVMHPKYISKVLKHSMQKQNTHYMKPEGIWFSRGEWLFHTNCCNLDNHIMLITVNPQAKLYKITDLPQHSKSNNPPPTIGQNYMKSITKFKKQYQALSGKHFCATDIDIVMSNKINGNNVKKTIAACRRKNIEQCNKDTQCIWIPGMDTYTWSKLLEQGYTGFMLDPYPSPVQLDKINSLAFETFDVSSLVIWDKSAISDYINMGSIRSILKTAGISNCTNYHTKTCLNILIDKILKSSNQISLMRSAILSDRVIP